LFSSLRIIRLLVSKFDYEKESLKKALREAKVISQTSWACPEEGQDMEKGAEVDEHF